MKLSFDKSKPHGTVTPPYNGAVWHQVASDGKSYYFNGNGDPVNIETGEPLTLEIEKPAPKMVKSKVMTVQSDGTKSVVEVEKEAPEEKDPRAELMKWLKGAQDAENNWMAVRSFGKQVFGKVASSKDELISWAVEDSMIPADQVRA